MSMLTQRVENNNCQPVQSESARARERTSLGNPEINFSDYRKCITAKSTCSLVGLGLLWRDMMWRVHWNVIFICIWRLATNFVPNWICSVAGHISLLGQQKISGVFICGVCLTRVLSSTTNNSNYNALQRAILQRWFFSFFRRCIDFMIGLIVIVCSGANRR